MRGTGRRLHRCRSGSPPTSNGPGVGVPLYVVYQAAAGGRSAVILTQGRRGSLVMARARADAIEPSILMGAMLGARRRCASLFEPTIAARLGVPSRAARPWRLIEAKARQRTRVSSQTWRQVTTDAMTSRHARGVPRRAGKTTRINFWQAGRAPEEGRNGYYSVDTPRHANRRMRWIRRSARAMLSKPTSLRQPRRTAGPPSQRAPWQ